jgi:hypothetical protein
MAWYMEKQTQEGRLESAEEAEQEVSLLFKVRFGRGFEASSRIFKND